MTVEAFLVFGWALKFSQMTILTVLDRWPVRPIHHVFVTRRTVTIHTIQSFVDVLTVTEFDHLFFDFICRVEYSFMALQTSFGSQIIIGRVAGRDCRVNLGMAGETARFFGWMALGFLPQLEDLGMALFAGPFMPRRISY